MLNASDLIREDLSLRRHRDVSGRAFKQAQACGLLDTPDALAERTLRQVEGRARLAAEVKGYEMTYWFAAYVPAGTPATVVGRLNELLVSAAKSGTAASFYGPSGTELVTSSPDELRKFQASESVKWGAIIKSAGIEAE